MNDNVIIAIDGPAGSGKSTVAKLLAKKLNFVYIDTGAMYRAITYKVISNNISISDSEKIIELAKNTSLSFKNSKIHANDKDISVEIRLPEVNDTVSQISSIPEIREILISIQRTIASNDSIVMEGRDIGSVVFPQAEFKFYLEASVEERTSRRYQELMEKNIPITEDKVRQSIIDRDNMDKNRNVSPLIQAKDALLVDTSNMNIEQVVNHLFEAVTT